MGKVIRPFCWHQNFVPWGLSAPALGLYTCIKSWKICIKSDFKEISLKLATNEWSDKTFLLTSKLCPLGAVCPCPGAIYMYKIMIFFYKIRLQKTFFFKLSTNDWSDKMFLLTVTHGSTVARTVMCRQDGRGRFPVSLDDHSKCRTNSQRKSQLS